MAVATKWEKRKVCLWDKRKAQPWEKRQLLPIRALEEHRLRHKLERMGKMVDCKCSSS